MTYHLFKDGAFTPEMEQYCQDELQLLFVPATITITSPKDPDFHYEFPITCAFPTEEQVILLRLKFTDIIITNDIQSLVPDDEDLE